MLNLLFGNIIKPKTRRVEDSGKTFEIDVLKHQVICDLPNPMTCKLCKTEVACRGERPFDEMGVVGICNHPKVLEIQKKDERFICVKNTPWMGEDFDNGISY